MRRVCVMLVLTILPDATLAAGEVCVQNGTDVSYLFTVESAAGTRARADLAPGAELCLTAGAAPGGVVAVFESADSIEGCSRILGPSGRETLDAYGAFDRCRWAPHG